jgi:hypothetical protein
MRTQGSLEADTPNTDGQIFLGPSADWVPTTGTAPVTTAGAGLLYQLVAASETCNLFSAISQMLRTGQFPRVPYSSQQFGTAAAIPGPSSVANTGGPSGINGRPPFTGANLATVKGQGAQPIPKGLQINWIDLIYQVLGVALTSVTFGLTNTQFVNAVAPAVTNIVALGANGLTTAVDAQPVRTRITPATPAFSILDGSELIANLNFVTPAGSTVKFYGAVLGVSFNFN